MKAYKRIVIIAVLLLAVVLSLSACSTMSYSYILGSDGSLSFIYETVIDRTFDYSIVGLSYEQMCGFTGRYFEALNSFCLERGFPCSYTVEDSSYNLIVFFESVTDYYIAANMTGEEVFVSDDDDIVIDKSFLFITETDTDLLNIMFYDTARATYDMFVTNCATYFGIDEDTVRLLPLQGTYVYGTPYDCIETNADHVKEENGVYYHTWDYYVSADGDNLDRQLITSITNLNSTGWIILSFIVALIACAITILIVLRKKKKTNEENIEYIVIPTEDIPSNPTDEDTEESKKNKKSDDEFFDF